MKRMTRELPKPRSAFARFLIRTFFYVGIFCAGTTLFVVGFFIFDASTYKEAPSIEAVPISSLALNPRTGGPKNLPIVEHFVDDDDSDCKKTTKHKPKIVILGTGWGSVSMLKNLKPEEYHVTVVSPSNQFLFTPMLPSATVGTLELRSLVEPVRKIVSRVHGHFLKAMAVDVALSEKLVEVEAVDTTSGSKQNFYIPYDKLIIACGMH
jgi:NADH:ubiquinone reductase (H+-translocating)